jgi:hypothetical protein
MSDYRSRHLTADGRVCSATHVILFPTKDNSIPSRLFGSWGADCGAPSITHDPVECGVCLPADTWFEGAANTWDATCTTCEGAKGFEGADHSDEPTRWYPCPTCNGTGVDETIPLHMIGIGSVLAHPDYAEFRCVVIARDASGCPKVAAVDTDGGLRSSFVAWDDGWTVARAVPPAHTEATP